MFWNLIYVNPFLSFLTSNLIQSDLPIIFFVFTWIVLCQEHLSLIWLKVLSWQESLNTSVVYETFQV